jgi:hypothetical protein
MFPRDAGMSHGRDGRDGAHGLEIPVRVLRAVRPVRGYSIQRVNVTGAMRALDGNGTTTVGIYDPSSGFFGYGPPNAKPLVGDWNGQWRPW